MKQFFVLMALCAFTFTSAVHSQTYCDVQLDNLKDFVLVAKYEQLPKEQRGNFFSQLTPDQQIKLNILQSSHKFGAALNKSLGGNYSDSVADVYNRKFEAFKTKCGFMLK